MFYPVQQGSTVFHHLLCWQPFQYLKTATMSPLNLLSPIMPCVFLSTSPATVGIQRLLSLSLLTSGPSPDSLHPSYNAVPKTVIVFALFLCRWRGKQKVTEWKQMLVCCFLSGLWKRFNKTIIAVYFETQMPWYSFSSNKNVVFQYLCCF